VSESGARVWLALLWGGGGVALHCLALQHLNRRPLSFVLVLTIVKSTEVVLNYFSDGLWEFWLAWAAPFWLVLPIAALLARELKGAGHILEAPRRRFRRPSVRSELDPAPDLKPDTPH